MKRYLWRLLALVLMIAGGIPELPKKVWSIASKANPGPVMIAGRWHIPTRLGLMAVPQGAAGGDTDTSSLEESLPSVVLGARQVREQVGQDFISSTDRKTLPMGMGSSWREIDMAKIVAQAVPQGTKLDNPQQLSDNLIAVEPTISGVHVIVTPELKHFVSQNVAEEWGGLMQNAIRRRTDRLGLDIYDGATVTGGGTGTTLNSGIISAMVAQIEGDADESSLVGEEIFFWHHGFQMHDIRTELTGGVGTYPLPAGLSADAFAQGASVVREVGGAIARRNNNVRIDTTPDAHGGVHARTGIVFVEVTGKQRAFTRILENQAGAEAMWLYDWNGFVERSAGNWVKRVLTNATAPTTG